MTPPRRWPAAALCAATVLVACSADGMGTVASPRGAMRDFVIALASQARERSPGFLVVPQNGLELLTVDGSASGPVVANYVAAIDGVGQEDVSFGYPVDEAPTPRGDRDRLLAFLDRVRESGRGVIVVDYCRAPEHIGAARDVSAAHGFAGYAAPDRNLSIIATDAFQPFQWSAENVLTLASARNALCLLNPERFADERALVTAIAATSYDIVVLDAWFDIDRPLKRSDLETLQRKPGGGRRLVLAYVSIGEAEDYRSDWNPAWSAQPPPWLGDENPDWPGNYAVEFWNPEWQAIVGRRLAAIVDAGFDGVYLDKVDAYETFEPAP